MFFAIAELFELSTARYKLSDKCEEKIRWVSVNLGWD